MFAKFNSMAWLISLLVALAVAGCAPQDPVQQALASRAEYTVQSASFLPQRQVSDASMEDEMLSEGDEIAGDEEALDEATDEGGPVDVDAMEEDADMVSAPVATPILFDVVLTFAGNDPLPGITLDVVHKDPFDNVKEVRRQYVETPNLMKGTVQQSDFVLEDFAFEEGDTFEVELRLDVSPEEYGEYRELAQP